VKLNICVEQNALQYTYLRPTTTGPSAVGEEPDPVRDMGCYLNEIIGTAVRPGEC
jgi:hypothetical protein